MVAPYNAKLRSSLGFYLFCDLGGDEILDCLLDGKGQFVTSPVRVDSRLILQKDLGQIEALRVELLFVSHNNPLDSIMTRIMAIVTTKDVTTT
jgi:hypothetical protein